LIDVVVANENLQRMSNLCLCRIPDRGRDRSCGWRAFGPLL
jgi:hypothetical protein